MKPRVAFGMGAVVALIIACAFFGLRESKMRKFAEVRIAASEEKVRRVESDLARAREAAHLAQAAQSIHEPEPMRPPTLNSPTPIGSSSNAAIVNYLGEPVRAPDGLDSKYSAEEMSAVFRSVCESLGIKIEKLAVDTTEFPFVVHGLVERQLGNDFFRRIEAKLREVPGYSYVGSTSGRSKDGASFFVMSITPRKVYPPEHADAIERRLMLRLQMIGAAWKEPPP
jgi:hypothetical protein